MSKQTMQWIREQYGVPAEKGREITFEGEPATIVGTTGPHLLIRTARYKHPVPIHPTWEVDYTPRPKTEVEG